MSFAVKKKILSVAVASAFAAITPAAMAVTIQATANYTIDGGANTLVDSGVATSGSVDILPSDNGVGSSSIFGHTYGDVSGEFGSRASVAGVSTLSGLFHYTDAVTNNSGSAQPYMFNFHVVPGEVSAYAGSNNAGDLAKAGYSIVIRLNGLIIWDSAYEVTSTSTGLDDATVSTVSSGVSLGGAPDALGYYSVPDYSDTLNLGIFASGSSFTIDYQLLAYAESNITGQCGWASTSGEFAGGEGYGGCGAIARSGDPLSQFNNGPFPGPNTLGITSQGTSVPEPATLLLLGAGLAGIGLGRKRWHA